MSIFFLEIYLTYFLNSCHGSFCLFVCFNIKAQLISDNFETVSTAVTGHYPSIQLLSMAGFQIKELKFNNLCYFLSGYRKTLPFITTYVRRKENSTLKRNTWQVTHWLQYLIENIQQQRI